VAAPTAGFMRPPATIKGYCNGNPFFSTSRSSPPKSDSCIVPSPLAKRSGCEAPSSPSPALSPSPENGCGAPSLLLPPACALAPASACTSAPATACAGLPPQRRLAPPLVPEHHSVLGTDGAGQSHGAAGARHAVELSFKDRVAQARASHDATVSLTDRDKQIALSIRSTRRTAVPSAAQSARGPARHSSPGVKRMWSSTSKNKEVML